MAEVVAIHGGTNPQEPVADIVADVEKLLERARSGELRALAYATWGAGDIKGTGWAGDAGTRASLAMVIGMLNHRYFEALLVTGVPVGD